MNTARRPIVSLVILSATLAASTLQYGCESSQTRESNSTTDAPVSTKSTVASDNKVIQFIPTRMDAQAKKVWDRSIAATMSANAESRNVKNIKMVGTMSMPAQGIEADMLILIAGEQGLRVETEIPGLGAFTQGVSDGVAWSNNMMEGPKILEGDEAEPFLKQNDLYADLNWEDYYISVTYMGQETLTLPDGSTVETDVLSLLDLDDETKSTQYYSKETGRLVKATATVPMAGAKIPVTTYPSDYRNVEGIFLPFKSVTQMGPVQQVMEFTSVVVNAEINPSELAMPDDIKELLED